MRGLADSDTWLVFKNQEDGLRCVAVPLSRKSLVYLSGQVVAGEMKFTMGESQRAYRLFAKNSFAVPPLPRKEGSRSRLWCWTRRSLEQREKEEDNNG